MNGQTLITFCVVHIVRGTKLIWTKPDALSRNAAEAYAATFNASVRARTYAEEAVIVEQAVFAELPEAVTE